MHERLLLFPSCWPHVELHFGKQCREYYLGRKQPDESFTRFPCKVTPVITSDL
jgi:hypothetical protein